MIGLVLEVFVPAEKSVSRVECAGMLRECSGSCFLAVVAHAETGGALHSMSIQCNMNRSKHPLPPLHPHPTPTPPLPPHPHPHPHPLRWIYFIFACSIKKDLEMYMCLIYFILFVYESHVISRSPGFQAFACLNDRWCGKAPAQ